MLTPADLQREAAATGFQAEALEKVIRLLEVLDGVRSHPFLKSCMVLKGSTALNLFVLDLPRLSVDIDHTTSVRQTVIRCSPSGRRLRAFEQIPTRTPNPAKLVDAILAGLTDARSLFAQGTMEERKRVIRAFVENLTVDGVGGHAELRTKRIPDALSIRDSFKVVAGIRCEVQQRDGVGEVEVIPLRFSGQGMAMVLGGVGVGAE